MRSGAMVAWLLVAGLLEAAHVSSTSTGLSRLWGGQHSGDGAASAVLSADGDSFLVNATSNHQDVPETPMCGEPCEVYVGGATQKTESICNNDGTCSLTGCGTHGACIQKFMDECPDQCSEWTDADDKTLNVCQHKKKTYKCLNGEKFCTTDTNRCKQKPITDCHLFCDGYQESNLEGVNTPDMDSKLVCQSINTKTENFGMCMQPPCDTTHHNSKNYDTTNICRQTHPFCKNTCTATSDKPNATTVCYDEWTSKCENHPNRCPVHMTRCQPAIRHQNLTNIDKSKDEGTHGYGLLDLEKSAKMTQAEYSASQRKARIEALLQSERKAVMRRNSA